MCHSSCIMKDWSKFSVKNTWKFIEFLIFNDFKFEFYLNDTDIISSRYLPTELSNIINNNPTKVFKVVSRSIFSISEKMVILLELKIDILNRIICLFPIEVKYSINDQPAYSLIDELVAENNTEFDTLQNILNNININSELKLQSRINCDINPLLESLKVFLDKIWGCDNSFWDLNEACNTTVKDWHKKLCESDSLITIYGRLIVIPESLICEYFENGDLDFINCDSLSTDSRRCIEKIQEYLEDEISFTKTGFVPKFTWSTPTDATWVLPNREICCKTIEDAFLLLKASTKISEDIDKAKKIGVEHVLLLREYIPTLNDMLEFRVFTGGFKSEFEYKILGISQRNIYNYYEELSENENMRKKILSGVLNFFEQRDLVLQIFNVFSTKFLAFDIYLLSKKNKYSVIIVDIQPLINTSTLLFNISELKLYLLSESKDNTDLGILRIIEDRNSVKNGLKNNYLKGTVPEEFLTFQYKDNFDTNDYLEFFEWE